MAGETIDRLNYYQFQYVGAEDFRDQQAYHRDMRRRHNLGPHTWGIVCGAEIREVDREGDAPFVDIQVTPGIVVDGFGREIVLLEPVRIDPELFAAYATDRHLELWIGYDELAARTATGGFAPCTDASAYARLVETYRFVVGSRGPVGASDAWRQSLIVGGKPALPAATATPSDPIEPDDASLPYQDFPDLERGALWLVQLGWVHWDGTVLKFRKAASEEKRKEGRRYAGFVGGSLLTDGPLLRIGRRRRPADVEASPFATLEGRLVVEGTMAARKNVNIEGGRLQLLASGGIDENRPLWLSRIGASVGSGADLRIHIGDNPDAHTRLTVGPGPSPTAPATEKVVFAVAGDDKVHIPTGELRFGDGARTLVDLGPDSGATAGQNAIGRQGSSVYHRSQGGHFWYLAGVHAPNDGDPGAGGAQQLALTAGGTLRFAAPFRTMVEAEVVAGETYAVGAQDKVLYARSQNSFAWYRRGAHDSNYLNPGGGAVAMTLDAANELSVRGNVRAGGKVIANGDVELNGSRLSFLDAAGGNDTDPLEMMRSRRAADQNDLRIVIGDNTGGEDRLVVGTAPGGNFAERFIVQNDGTVRMVGDLWVGSRKPLIDVIAGEFFLNRTSQGSAQVEVPVATNMPRFSTLSYMVALSDVGNNSTAINARWSVRPAGWVRINDTNARLRINWRVDDSDGQLFWFSYVVIFQP